MLLTLSISVYTLGFFFEYFFQDTKTVLWGRDFRQIGYSLSVSTLFVLVLDYTGKIKLLRPVSLALLYIVPLIGIGLRWTDKYHHLMRKNVFLAKGQLVAVSTPLAAGLMFFEYIMGIIAVLMLIEFYQKADPQVRKQLIGIAAAIMIPLTAETIKPVRPELILVIPPTSVMLTLTGIIIFGSIFRFQLFSILPVPGERIMESIQEGIIILDDFGRVIDKNYAADGFVREMLGESRDIVGESAENLFFVWPRWLSACKNRQADEFQIDTSFGGAKRYYRVKVYPLHEKSLKTRGTVSILSDITENKTCQELLISKMKLGQKTLRDLAEEWKMFKKQLESILENIILQNKQMETMIKIIPDIAILAILDHEGNYIRNSKAANGFTYKKGVFFYQDGREMDYLDMPELRVLRGEEVSDFQFSIKNKKNERHYLFNGSPIYDRQGNLSCGVFVTLEVTEQVLHQRLIPVTEQLEALNALKDKLFTVVTHDIRNPMATMVSLIELLEGEKETYGSETMEIIEAVKEQVDNIYTIVENLLEWLKTQQKGLVCDPLVWDLSGIVQDVIKAYQINAGVKSINITSGILEGTNVFADKDSLELVLRNLLSNAIKFTDNGGIISIQACEAGNEIIVAVRDNGMGMSQAKAESLFREAYVSSTRGTAGEKGIGLGLLICKEFVMRNGGKIWVESTPGKGSTFRFSLLNSDKMTIQK